MGQFSELHVRTIILPARGDTLFFARDDLELSYIPDRQKKGVPILISGMRINKNPTPVKSGKNIQE